MLWDRHDAPPRHNAAATVTAPWLWEASETPGEPPVVQRWAVYPLLIGTILALGINWPFIAIALDEIPPIWLSAHRLIGSVLTLGIVLGARGRLTPPDPADRRLIRVVGIGRMMLVMMMALFALSLVPPGRSSILVYTSALWTVPLAAAMLGERLTRLRAMGLAMGVTGLVVLLDPSRMDWTDPENVFGHALLLGAAWIMAYITVLIRGHRWTASPLELLFWQVLIAVPVVAFVAFILSGPPTFDWSATTWLIVIYQGTMATPFAVWATHSLLRRLAAGTTNLALNLVPVVGVLASVWLVGEELTVRSVVALVLILAGVWIGVALDTRRAV